jgi:hypothetical protein
MPAAMELRSAQIVVEDGKAILRINVLGASRDYSLNRDQLLLLCKQGIHAFADLMVGPRHADPAG